MSYIQLVLGYDHGVAVLDTVDGTVTSIRICLSIEVLHRDTIWNEARMRADRDRALKVGKVPGEAAQVGVDLSQATFVDATGLGVGGKDVVAWLVVALIGKATLTSLFWDVTDITVSSDQ